MTSEHVEAAGPADRPLGEELDWTPVAPPPRRALKGRRVLVRPIDAAQDAEPLYRVSHPPGGDPAIWDYLPDGPYESPAALRDALAAAQGLDDPLFFTFIRLPEEEPQGVASYLRITPAHGVIEIGHIWFGTPLQRTAAATEAIYLLLAQAFDDLGYRRVEWKCNALNQGSRRAAERFGFRFEGVFRQHQVIKGRNRDTAWYAITDSDWPAVRAGFGRWLAEENFDQTGRQRRKLGQLISEARG
jgi:RimJ/RimL family protein N-acetyltransferase